MNVMALPTKEQVRQWLHKRRTMPMPLPPLETVRAEVGWTVAPAVCTAQDTASLANARERR